MITVRTIVEEVGVQYTVERGRDLLWGRLVKFGKDRAHRAGGPAFVQASEEQTRMAARMAQPGEQTEELIGGRR